MQQQGLFTSYVIFILSRSLIPSLSISLCLALVLECLHCIVLAGCDYEQMSVTSMSGNKTQSSPWNAALEEGEMAYSHIQYGGLGVEQRHHCKCVCGGAAPDQRPEQVVFQPFEAKRLLPHTPSHGWGVHIWVIAAYIFGQMGNG